MKIAIDLDNTITATRESIEFFSTLTYLLDPVSEITILTNRTPGSEQEIADELDFLGIEYGQIVITANKAKYIIENRIDVFFEDTDEYYLGLPESVLVFKIREDGNFNFDTHKWVGSEKTTEII